MNVQWWGPARGDASGAPLHRMLDVSADVLRRALCSGAVGTGYTKQSSNWKPGERCSDCLTAQVFTGGD